VLANVYCWSAQLNNTLAIKSKKTEFLQKASFTSTILPVFTVNNLTCCYMLEGYDTAMDRKVILVAAAIVMAVGAGYLINKQDAKDTSSSGQTSSSKNAEPAQSGTTLDLSGQQLSELPDSVLNRNDIVILNLSNNQLTGLPAGIGKLVNLEILNIENNRLESLPGEISQLKNLREIRANNNRLATLPPELSTMTHLRLLDISGNRLSSEQTNQLESALPDTEVKQ